jgi:pantoate kinase
MSAHRVLSSRAFAPGHVTGIFRPEVTQRDPRARGSVGAGVVLELGARAEASFSPGRRSGVRVVAGSSGSLPISEDVARRMAPDDPGILTVRLTHELPVGQGFGMSAAGALATALAVGALSTDSREHAVRVAHLADLFGGGGLGGVAAILGGGLEIRRRPGVPPFGEVTHRRFASALIVGVVGRAIPSPSVLGNAATLRRITDASHGWDELARRPSVDQFFELSERFTDRAGLASPAVTRTISALRRRGASACQAMFGQSFFARPGSAKSRTACLDWLERAQLRAVEVHASARGARLLPERPE